jgi:hypothetical protein
MECVKCNEYLPINKFHHATLKSIKCPNICKECKKLHHERAPLTCKKCEKYNESGFIEIERPGRPHYISRFIVQNWININYYCNFCNYCVNSRTRMV